MPLGVIDGTDPQASRQRVPVSGVEHRGRTLPEVPTELTGYLPDRELVCPGSEPAIPAELGELGRDGEQGIVGRLVGQVVQFRAGDQVPRRATAQLSMCDTQQQTVQPLSACSRVLPVLPSADSRRAVSLSGPSTSIIPANTTTPLWSPPARKEPPYLAQPPSIQPVRGGQSGISVAP